MNRRAMHWGLWCGPAVGIIFAIGGAGLALFLPVRIAPSYSAEHVAHIYASHETSIRIGAVLSMLSLMLLAPWGVAIAGQTRRREGRSPTLAWTQIISMSVAIGTAIATCVFWSVAAFRPTDTDPDITRALNDIAYFFFIYTWPPFALWSASMGLSILLDEVEDAVFPRWAGFVCFTNTIILTGGTFVSFFKKGVFAYNGLIGIYLPAGFFFVWLLTLTWLGLRNVREGMYDPPVPLELPA